jgi:hypothetical protein
MKFIRAAIAAVLAITAVGNAEAGAKKQSSAAVRFYAEGGAEGADFSQKVELLNSKRPVYMQSMPLITEREIKAFYPFPAQDGSGTFGAYFKLDSHGSSLLGQHTMSRRGSYLLAFFNGRHVTDLYIDRGVNDGIVSIPSGLSRNDLDLLEMAFPIIGQESVKPGKKKKVSEPKPTPLKASDMPRPQPAVVRQPDGTFAPAKASLGPTQGSATDPLPKTPVGQTE